MPAILAQIRKRPTEFTENRQDLPEPPRSRQEGNVRNFVRIPPVTLKLPVHSAWSLGSRVVGGMGPQRNPALLHGSLLGAGVRGASLQERAPGA